MRGCRRRESEKEPGRAGSTPRARRLPILSCTTAATTSSRACIIMLAWLQTRTVWQEEEQVRRRLNRETEEVPWPCIRAFVRVCVHVCVFECMHARRKLRHCEASLRHSGTLIHTHLRNHAHPHTLARSLARSLAHLLTHALTHSLAHSLAHSLTHARVHRRTHARTHVHMQGQDSRAV